MSPGRSHENPAGGANHYTKPHEGLLTFWCNDGEPSDFTLTNRHAYDYSKILEGHWPVPSILEILLVRFGSLLLNED
jgi:hypothetical protein